MKTFGAVALGLAVGFLAGVLVGPASESSCCKRISAAARDEIKDRFGGTAAVVSDATGLTDRIPQLLDLFGVDT